MEKSQRREEYWKLGLKESAYVGQLRDRGDWSKKWITRGRSQISKRIS